MTAADNDDTTPDSYRAAMDELDAILAALEGDDVDVDTLAERVRRAGELLTFCRTRVDAARVEIEQIVAGMADEDEVEENDAAADRGGSGGGTGDGSGDPGDDEIDWEIDEGTLFDDA